ncbi:oligosaccharide repeat unit polymerase [Streptomyces sp. N2-109]|uniref:Oligosaccharide repeat unit polymerase n=1 Tax=Streptomyces gossypii TaxID=2883101 RepID=A0ABT2JQH1_9ACTN|nr:O-antigen polymerase [Streptomyces gossypii]MCT2590130.1 oligosaccharide repeat unit polymerase [Streptomyces gossypii]
MGGSPAPVREPVELRDATPRALLSRALAVPLVVGMVGVLPVAVASQDGPGLRDAAFWLQLTLCCYAGARLSAMVLTARRRLVQGSFWLFVYIAMGIAPLAQTVLARTPTPVVGPGEHTVLAIALVLGGVVAFDVGALLARHRPSLHGLGRRERPASTVHRHRLYLLVALAYAGSAVMIVQLGGVGVFFSSRQGISESLQAATGAESGGAAASQAGSAFLRGFGTVPALLALLFLTRWLVTSRTARRKPSVVLMWAGLLGLNVIVNNPVSNPRYWFLTVLFALLFTAFPRSPVMYRNALALGVVIALLVFPFADRFRYEEDGARQPESDSLLAPLTLKDYDQIGMFANTISFAEAGTGHTYGGQLSSTVLFFVPRSLWQGKAEDSGVRVGEWMGMKNTNLSSPLWAELWLDFGPLGMLGGFLGIGYLASRADRRYVRHTLDDTGPGNIPAVVIPLVAGYSFILLRGPLLQASGRIAIAALCLALVTTFRHQPQRKRLR